MRGRAVSGVSDSWLPRGLWTLVPDSWMVGGLRLEEGTGLCDRARNPPVSLGEERDVQYLLLGKGDPSICGEDGHTKMRGGGKGPGGLWGVARHQE